MSRAGAELGQEQGRSRAGTGQGQEQEPGKSRRRAGLEQIFRSAGLVSFLLNQQIKDHNMDKRDISNTTKESPLTYCCYELPYFSCGISYWSSGFMGGP